MMAFISTYILMSSWEKLDVLSAKFLEPFTANNILSDPNELFEFLTLGFTRGYCMRALNSYMRRLLWDIIVPRLFEEKRGIKK
jgi:hypothetical protein